MHGFASSWRPAARRLEPTRGNVHCRRKGHDVVHDLFDDVDDDDDDDGDGDGDDDIGGLDPQCRSAAPADVAPA